MLDEGAIQWSRNDLDSDKTGRTMDGLMHRTRITAKRKLQISCARMTTAQMASLNKALFPQFITVTFLDPLSGGNYTGTFYGSEIKEGRLNQDWGTIHFAFTTYDGTGPYNHAGRLAGGRLEGTTNSVGRRFLAVWRAERGR